MNDELNLITFKMNSYKENIETLSKKIEASQEASKLLTNELFTLDESKNILTILKNHKMESKKDFILQTINAAIDEVFDQNLKIDIVANSSNISSGKINMKYDIVLHQNNIEIARNEKLLGNNGGGVLSFISILFKILVGYIYSDNKFFLFDESISQVSPLYRPRLASFLRQFCERYDFTIVLISQTDDIDEYAHVGYLLDSSIEDSIVTLEIANIIGEYPEDKYTYAKIENFQSIKKLEFRYKGFTVIRGNNNIGKSASFRAINSLLFNTFDAKDHPRKKRKRGEEVSIKFGRVDSDRPELVKSEIHLKYKSNKVIYEFDGLEFAGKSLAFEKVKEKVELIGFRYVNLNDTYRNFKGNLKDQTERLALTTQYDGFYLVGNKSNETEKVFNFLFDSTVVANAIASISLDILSKNKALEINISNINSDHTLLEKEKISYQLYVYKFYNLLINQYILNDKRLFILNHISNHYKDIIAYIAYIEDLSKGIYIIEINSIALKKLNSNNTKIEIKILENLINYNDNINVIEKYLILNNNIKSHKNKNNNITHTINKLTELIEDTKKFNLIQKYIPMKLSYNLLQDNLNNINSKILINNNMITILNEINSYDYYLKAFSNYFNLKNNNLQTTYNSYQSQILKIDKIINNYNTKKALDNYIIEYNYNLELLITHNNNLSDHNIKESDLDIEFGMYTCSHCNGSGISHV